MDETMLFVIIFTVLPIARGAVPGLFFWKPRLGLDLAIPTTEVSISVQKPTLDNVREGRVVLIDGYQAGMTVIGFAAGASSAKPYPHLDPLSAYYHTNAYRWLLRHLSLIPFWLGGHGGSYCDTHKVWRRRFYYGDEFIPDWLKSIFPYVKQKSWDQEVIDYKRFKKYAEPAFGKHYRFPTKSYNYFKSFETAETEEGSESSSSSSYSK